MYKFAYGASFECVSQCVWKCFTRYVSLQCGVSVSSVGRVFSLLRPPLPPIFFSLSKQPTIFLYKLAISFTRERVSQRACNHRPKKNPYIFFPKFEGSCLTDWIMCQESTVTVKIILESASTEETDDNIIYFEKE